MSGSRRYCGREFTKDELEVVRGLVASLPTRRAIADALCDALYWLRPDGRRKDMSARVALGRMERDGVVVLPPPRNGNGNGAIPRHTEPAPELPLVLPGSLDVLGPIELVMVTTKAASQRWRSLISSYHYLGYTPFAGAQLRYLIETSVATIGAPGFAAQHGPVRHGIPISVGTGLPGKLAPTSWSETPAS